MCSCFCETFCCFLLRCRDSCSRDTHTPSSSRNAEREIPMNSDSQVQPPPHPPMPQFSGSSMHGSGTPASSRSNTGLNDSGDLGAPHPPFHHPPSRQIQSPTPFQPLANRSLPHLPPPASQPQDPSSQPAATRSAPYDPLDLQYDLDTRSASPPPRYLPEQSPTHSSLPLRPHDAAAARVSRAFLSSLDDMPSASDFAVASDLGGFEPEYEMEVPRPPELEGESSTKAWREESRERKKKTT